MSKFLFRFATLASLIIFASGVDAAMKKTFISIGTGDVKDLSYSSGRAICRLVNKRRKDHGVRCSAEVTGGSIENINAVRDGELDMGLARSDFQFRAYSGGPGFNNRGPFNGLRAMFSIHALPVNIVARQDSRITNVNHLVGKRVNLGGSGSFHFHTWKVMWHAMGKKEANLKLATDIDLMQIPSALCNNQIDAFFWVGTHPNSIIKDATNTCNTVLAVVENSAIAGLIKENPFYRSISIPGGMYRGNPKDIKTFGLGATMVTSIRTSPNTVYEVVKSVFEDFDEFKNLHPAFAVLRKKEMIREALSAPLHIGALKYYKERGWI
tara:strand:+ start:882 stop:1853 length:972 start_codon:yes stop_codon:yes gene_type:complete